MSGVSVEVTGWDRAMPLVRPVRYAVFVAEQGVPVELEWDGHDAVSEHAIARDERGEVVGTGRLLPDGHIGRMAVVREARGRGVGGLVLAALLGRARDRGMPLAVLNAQTHAVPFYARHGFEGVGDVFMEAGIPHVEMRRALAPA